MAKMSFRLLVSWSLAFSVLAQAAGHQVVAFNFDWDDNIVFMPTKVYVFDRASGEQKGVSTADFAEVRHRVYGTKGEPPHEKNTTWRGVDWGRYELRGDDATGSFREFRDLNGENRFLSDVRRMIRRARTTAWQAPSFKDFQTSLSSPDAAKWSAVITARSHDPEKMLEGVRYLQQRGYVRHLPEVGHLYAVANPRFQGSSASPSEAKAKIMMQLLDQVDREPLQADMPAVLDRDGSASKVLHLWGFSDDDFGNYETAARLLSAEVKKGRWPNVKITLFYSGTRHDGVSPHAKVIKSDGSLRARTATEETEPERVLRAASAPLPRAAGGSR